MLQQNLAGFCSGYTPGGAHILNIKGPLCDAEVCSFLCCASVRPQRHKIGSVAWRGAWRPKSWAWLNFRRQKGLRRKLSPAASTITAAVPKGVPWTMNGKAYFCVTASDLVWKLQWFAKLWRFWSYSNYRIIPQGKHERCMKCGKLKIKIK